MAEYSACFYKDYNSKRSHSAAHHTVKTMQIFDGISGDLGTYSPRNTSSYLYKHAEFRNGLLLGEILYWFIF